MEKKYRIAEGFSLQVSENGVLLKWNTYRTISIILHSLQTHYVVETDSGSRHNWSYNFYVLQLKVFFFHCHTEHGSCIAHIAYITWQLRY